VISMDSIGTLPVKILPQAESSSRAVRLGLGVVETISVSDANCIRLVEAKTIARAPHKLGSGNLPYFPWQTTSDSPVA